MVLRLLVLIFVSAKGKQGDELTSGRVDKLTSGRVDKAPNTPRSLVNSSTRPLEFINLKN